MSILIGTDWSENKHDIEFMNEAGTALAQLTIPDSPNGFLKFDATRRQWGIAPNECLIALETAHNLLIDFLWSHHYTQVYVVPPSVVKQVKKRRRDINFTDLQNESDFEEYLDEVLPYLEDPRCVEAVDELFIRRIEEILDGMHNWRFRFSTRQAINDAHQILDLFRDNANLGKGIGIDEYENGPLTAPKHGRPRIGRPTHNTKPVLRAIVNHLSEELQTGKRNIHRAYKALRISTRQALNEGWLPS